MGVGRHQDDELGRIVHEQIGHVGDGLLQRQLQYAGMSVLCEYAIAAYFAYCHIFRTFQQSMHMAYFFRINWHFRRQFQYSLCFYYLFLLGFVTLTILLPTEWHHPCAWTPVE